MLEQLNQQVLFAAVTIICMVISIAMLVTLSADL